MQQHRKLWVLSTIFIIGLTGCGNDGETALQDKQTKNTTPVGYYSNEEHESKGGNAILLDGSDNDGPATEIMDHTWGVERETNKRYLRVNNKNDNQGNNRTIADTQQDNLNAGTSHLGQTDMNYHGHMNRANLPTRQSYYNGYEGNFSEQITQTTEKVENVKEAHTFVDDKKVIIAVLLDDKVRANETKRKIQQAVQPLMNGREFEISTNESQFNRLEVIDHNLRNGGSEEKLNEDMENVPQSNRNNQ